MSGDAANVAPTYDLDCATCTQESISQETRIDDKTRANRCRRRDRERLRRFRSCERDLDRPMADAVLLFFSGMLWVSQMPGVGTVVA